MFRKHSGAALSALCLFALLSGALAQAQTPLSNGVYLPEERDYLFPPEAPEARAQVLGVVEPAAPCFGCGKEKVTYRAFDGRVYTLIRYPGRFVALLVPEVFEGGDGFTEDEVRVLLDRSDLMYQHYVDLMQREPDGSGLLPIVCPRP
jgi:hypothetical protein